MELGASVSELYANAMGTTNQGISILRWTSPVRCIEGASRIENGNPYETLEHPHLPNLCFQTSRSDSFHPHRSRQLGLCATSAVPSSFSTSRFRFRLFESSCSALP